jgi:hypothetical protein
MEDDANVAAMPAASSKSSTRKQLHLVALNFRVPFQVRQKVKAYAVERGISMTDVLIAALHMAGVLEQD